MRDFLIMKKAVKSTLSWSDVINKHKVLVIPYYQRGYIWGKRSNERSTDAVTFMLDSLEKNYEDDVFIQGITVSEDEKSITIIDGQQRTTFFYLLLRLMGNDSIQLKYMGSRGADAASCDGLTPAEWIADFNKDTECEEDENEYYQDIYYFKKTVRLIRERLEKIELNDVLNHVRFLWIKISEAQQLASFQMMNGNKAEMKSHELLKADMLRRASSGDGGYADTAAQEWDNNILRRNYAKSWDKWLYWWNQPKVKDMYRLRDEDENTLGRLLPFSFSDGPRDLNIYEKWKFRIANEPLAMHAKRIFNTLRCNQIMMEEAFSDVVLYNSIGVILCLARNDDAEKFLFNYFGAKRQTVFENLDLVINLLLFGATIQEILEQTYINDEGVKNKIFGNAKHIQSNPLYSEGRESRELAYKYLLVRNVEKDTGRRRKFDFSIWNGNRSLEHVMPKSRVFHRNPDNEDQWLNYKEDIAEPDYVDQMFSLSREEIKNKQNRLCKENESEIWATILQSSAVNEHSIGNLLLLYNDENKQFGNKMPQDKRKDYFDVRSDIFKSRNLLHTMFTFCRFEHDFGADEILKNQIESINDINHRLQTIYPGNEKA